MYTFSYRNHYKPYAKAIHFHNKIITNPMRYRFHFHLTLLTRRRVGGFGHSARNRILSMSCVFFIIPKIDFLLLLVSFWGGTSPCGASLTIKTWFFCCTVSINFKFNCLRVNYSANTVVFLILRIIVYLFFY